MEKYDVVVIGGGPGGYPAAIRAAQLGASVALVEKERVGGTCLNWGCIPTKSLAASAHLFRMVRQADAFGVSVQNAAVDYPAMARRKDAIVDKLRNGVEQLLKANGVTLIRAAAAFQTRNRLAVAGESLETQVEAGRVIIASGSEPARIPNMPESPAIQDSRSFLGRTRLPRSLIVLGGGVIGCEFACIAAGMGVQVTVVELLEDVLIMADADVRREIRRHMEKQLGISVLTGRPLEDIKAGADGVKGSVAGNALSAECLLVAVGRKPSTVGLGLDKAGVRVNDKGCIAVDDGCRTSAASVYAVGDVTGWSQLAHAATAQGLAAAENACGARTSLKGRVVPSCIFTDPEIGLAGLTEQEAQKQGRAVKTGKFPFAALGRALAVGETAGFVKWIVDAATDQVVGAQAVGPNATELISEGALAIQSELTAREIARAIHAHPTLSEAWMEAAHAVHGECVHAAPRRKKEES